MDRQKVKIILLGIVGLVSVLIVVSISWKEKHPVSVSQLWGIENKHRNLEGKTITVRGDLIFDPLSDFRFNTLYLMDSETPEEYRQPAYGFWFGLRLDGVSCMADADMGIVTCEPFDPTQAKVYQFKGTIHIEQIGKKEIMWMSDVDFERSRQWIAGQWEPIPLGKFTIPLEKK